MSPRQHWKTVLMHLRIQSTSAWPWLNLGRKERAIAHEGARKQDMLLGPGHLLPCGGQVPEVNSGLVLLGEQLDLLCVG